MGNYFQTLVAPPLVLAMMLVACKRDDVKVCPDLAAAPAGAKPSPMRTIDVPLPKAVALDTPESVLSIAIEPSGRTSVNGIAIADDSALIDEAKRAIGRDPEVKAVILADTAVTHGRVIAVLDRIRMGGIAKMAFAVSAPAPAPATK